MAGLPSAPMTEWRSVAPPEWSALVNTGVAAAYSVLAVALLWSLGLLMAVAGAARVATDVAPVQPVALRGEPAQMGRH